MGWHHESCSQEDCHLPHLVLQIVLEVQVVEMVHVEHELPYCSMHHPIWDRDSSLKMPLLMLVLVPMSLGLQLAMTFELLPDQLLPDPALLEHASDLELVELELVVFGVVALAGWHVDSPTVCFSARKVFVFFALLRLFGWMLL